MESDLRQSKPSLATLFVVDSFLDGISVGQRRVEIAPALQQRHALGLDWAETGLQLRSRYAIHKPNPLWDLENQFMRLSRRGELSTSLIYFGVSCDPFHPFDGKFDASMRFLQLIQRYPPGLVIVQTRSPLAVISAPIFKALGERALVSIGVETNDEAAVRRYTPGLPRIEERLKAARALRSLGISVQIQASPLLPYGDWRTGAEAFAAMLAEYGDYVSVKPLVEVLGAYGRRSAHARLAQELASDRKFQYLRPDSAEPVLEALHKSAPEKLAPPKSPALQERQMGIFAA